MTIWSLKKRLSLKIKIALIFLSAFCRPSQPQLPGAKPQPPSPPKLEAAHSSSFKMAHGERRGRGAPECRLWSQRAPCLSAGIPRGAGKIKTNRNLIKGSCLFWGVGGSSQPQTEGPLSRKAAANQSFLLSTRCSADPYHNNKTSRNNYLFLLMSVLKLHPTPPHSTLAPLPRQTPSLLPLCSPFLLHGNKVMLVGYSERAETHLTLHLFLDKVLFVLIRSQGDCPTNPSILALRWLGIEGLPRLGRLTDGHK